MAPRNSLREDSQPQEAIRGDRLTNLSSERILRFWGPNGTGQEIVLGGLNSGLDSNGGYVDREATNIVIDHGGNILPENGPAALSHTGLYINNLEQAGHCTSMLHPPGRSRTFLDGQDGQKLGEGRGRCSLCQAILTTIHIVSAITGFGVLLGILRGTGLF